MVAHVKEKEVYIVYAWIHEKSFYDGVMQSLVRTRDIAGYLNMKECRMTMAVPFFVRVYLQRYWCYNCLQAWDHLMP